MQQEYFICNKSIFSGGGRSETEPKYRNDENVLEVIPAQYRPISIDIQNTPPRMVIF